MSISRTKGLRKFKPPLSGSIEITSHKFMLIRSTSKPFFLSFFLSFFLFSPTIPYSVLQVFNEIRGFFFLNVLLTVHPNVIIVFFYQIDAQILYFNTFSTSLYMFRALLCSSSGGQIVLV